MSSGRKSRRSHSASCSSLSQRHSSTRRRRLSSVSRSQSYSRSYTSSRSRSRGRSRSYSRSRSISRSRNQSLSRSRSSCSRSRSRSRSKYRSKSSSTRRSSSRSPRKRKSSKSKPDVNVHVTEKLPEGKVASVPRLSTVPAPENVPVIPLSDSPPPSRWKPGQKPWKPSYIHIQEIKAKVAPSALSSSGQAVNSVTDKAQTSGIPQQGNSESDKPHKTARHIRSSSRHRSYSRSYSRSSYSRSSSRSNSRSPYQYHSRSSSYSRSVSEDSQKTSRNKNNSLDKEWKEYYSSLSRIKNVDTFVSLKSSHDAHSESEHGKGSEHSPAISASSGSLEKIIEKGSSQEKETKHCGSVPVESFNDGSEWESDSDKVNNSAMPSKKQKQPARPHLQKQSADTGWNSESDSENVTAKTLAISDKEEGEASSESDFDTCRKTSEAVNALELKIDAAIASDQMEGCPEKATEPEKQKSKKKAKRKHKRKRRSENKTGSHHSKAKGKRSKRKHQKLKETFHWQPPLEFGDEEDEDESKKEKHSPRRVVKDGMNEKDQKVNPSNRNSTKEEDREQQKSKERINKNAKRTEPHQTARRNVADSAQLPSVKEQESLDDMDICTPEHDIEIAEPSVRHDPYNNLELTQKSTSDSSDTANKESGLPHIKEQSAVTSATTAAGPQDKTTTGKPTCTVIDFKWRPLKGTSTLQNVSPVTAHNIQIQENQTLGTQGVRMEIKSKSRVRPGSLFDEVRKTARLNQRPRNQESSSEERSPSVGKTRSRSQNKSRSVSRKSCSVSSHQSRSRGWSHSYSRSRSRSRNSSYSSR